MIGISAEGAYAWIMDLTKLRKVESTGARRAAKPVTGRLTAVIKVKKAGYRPAGVTVRAEMGEGIFTADFPAERLASLEKDPQIKTISLSRPLSSWKS